MADDVFPQGAKEIDQYHAGTSRIFTVLPQL